MDENVKMRLRSVVKRSGLTPNAYANILEQDVISDFEKFDELLRSKSGNVGIATFFHICEQNNIRYGEIIKRMRIKC